MNEWVEEWVKTEGFECGNSSLKLYEESILIGEVLRREVLIFR